jgi:hypothetical protein
MQNCSLLEDIYSSICSRSVCSGKYCSMPLSLQREGAAPSRRREEERRSRSFHPDDVIPQVHLQATHPVCSPRSNFDTTFKIPRARLETRDNPKSPRASLKSPKSKSHPRLVLHSFLRRRDKMMRNTATLKRLLASKLQRLQSLRSRSYHASSAVLADALDMTDTFARRHSKFSFPNDRLVEEADVMMTPCTRNLVDSTENETS